MNPAQIVVLVDDELVSFADLPHHLIRPYVVPSARNGALALAMLAALAPFDIVRWDLHLAELNAQPLPLGVRPLARAARPLRLHDGRPRQLPTQDDTHVMRVSFKPFIQAARRDEIDTPCAAFLAHGSIFHTCADIAPRWFG